MVFILVNSANYEIKMVEQMGIELDQGEKIGYCDYIKKRIYLSDLAFGKYLYKLLIHELTHAFTYEYTQKEFSEDNKWGVEDLAVFMENYGDEIIKASKIAYDKLKGIKK